jgi:hypothetical protein
MEVVSRVQILEDEIWKWYQKEEEREEDKSRMTGRMGEIL